MNSCVEPSSTQDEPDVAAILSAAADLLDKPGAWIQHDWALDEDGEPLFLGAGPALATCWCVQGALAAVAAGPVWVVANRALAEHLNVRHVPNWNDADGRTQREVVDGLRTAAAKATGKSQDGSPPQTPSEQNNDRC